MRAVLVMLVCVVGLEAAMVDVTPYKKLLLDLHNDYRRKVQPPAANMQIMVWDETLSNEAAAWSRGCRFEHQRKSRGENLAFDSNTHTNEEYIDGALEAWFDEKDLYRLGTQACGRACHYVQMVWHKTTKVGCAMNVCPSLFAFGRRVRNAWYLVCFYDPKGNWIGQKPYEAGKPCSQCLAGQTCDQGLCAGEEQEVCEDKEKNCGTWQSAGECNKNPVYMEQNCRKACGICKGGSGGGSGVSECTDGRKSCKTWADVGECQKNPTWMRENCKKSCNVCSAAYGGGAGFGDGRGTSGTGSGNDQDETECRNQLGCCQDLRRRGYCRRYRKFMRENCQAACNLC